MPIEPFDFTYSLTSQSAQNESLNALGKNRVIPVEPKSYFFTESTVAEQPNNSGAYGPENGSSTTRFNITTVFALTDKKAYAVTSGQVLIVPQAGDKVNVFIKPLKNVDVGVPIKYFVYRGLKKSLFIKSNNTILDYNNTSLTPFMTKVWADLIHFNEWTTPPANGTQVPASLFGFNTTEPLTTRIDSKFFNAYDDATTDVNRIYNLPIIEAGQYFGEFSDDTGGFEIVLNDGFYHQEKSDTGFEFDMNYATSVKAVLDITSIGTISEKIYRENVQNFLDPAAFYGAHITEKYKGEVKVVDNSAVYSNKDDIFNNIVSKFKNKYKFYLYIQCNRGRSFNFDTLLGADPMKIGITGNLGVTKYETNSWPIIIREDQQTHVNSDSAGKGFNNLSFQLKFKTLNKNIALYNTYGDCASNAIEGNFLSNKALVDESNLSQTYTNEVAYKLINTYNISENTSLTTNNVASFVHLGYEEKDIENFNDFFGPLTIEPLQRYNYIYPQNSVAIKASHNKPKIKKLNGDGGKSFSMSNLTISIFPYPNTTLPDIFKLYISKVLDSDDPDPPKVFGNDNAYGDFKTPEESGRFHYGDENYLVWKGIIHDNGENIKTLQLINFKKEGNVKNFFNFGLMGTDYDLLIYDSLTDSNTGHIPESAKNFYFHLDEENVVATSLYKKYRLGVKVDTFNIFGFFTHYDIFYPSAANELFVYTVDDQFYFTKAYSEKFIYAKEFSDATIDFKPLTDTLQNYGIDYMRVIEQNYLSYEESVVGGYIKNGDNGFDYLSPNIAYWELKKEYLNIVTGFNDIYYVPYLNMYPKIIESGVDINEVVLKGKLKLLQLGVITNLFFEYDKELFTVTAQLPTLVGTQTEYDFNLHITCNKEFNEDKFIIVNAQSLNSDGITVSKIAGMIKVCKNAVDMRSKKVKVYLYEVKTNVNNNNEVGVISEIEKETLIKVFRQTFIDVEIVGTFSKNMKNNSHFNITNTAWFTNTGKIIQTESCNNEILEYLRSQVSADTSKDNYVVFALDLYEQGSDPINETFVEGKVQKVGLNNITLYKSKPSGRDSFSLSHEFGHALGLEHTHRNGDVALSEDDFAQKFVFYGMLNPSPDGLGFNAVTEQSLLKSTNNLMSYRPSNTDSYLEYIKFSLWRWQQKIMFETINQKAK